MNFYFNLVLSESSEISPVWFRRYVVKVPEVGGIIFFRDNELLKKEVDFDLYKKYMPGFYRVGSIDLETSWIYCSAIFEPSFLVL